MKRQTFNEINITPLTDIFLVLLIIMMVIAPILDQQGLSLAVPEYVESTQQQEQKENKILTIRITQDNKYILDDTEIAKNNLFEIIKQEITQKTEGLMIEASGDSNHEAVVNLMDIARNAGVQSISIVEI